MLCVTGAGVGRGHTSVVFPAQKSQVLREGSRRHSGCSLPVPRLNGAKETGQGSGEGSAHLNAPTVTPT